MDKKVIPGGEAIHILAKLFGLEDLRIKEL